jgi:hypothetical protein
MTRRGLKTALASATSFAPSVWIGASVEFLAGVSRRAPAWMRRAVREWLFRLAGDPRRRPRCRRIDPAACSVPFQSGFTVTGKADADFVIPAQAGTHAAWVPAFAGMTGRQPTPPQDEGREALAACRTEFADRTVRAQLRPGSIG